MLTNRQEESLISEEIYKFLLSKKIFQRRNHANVSSYGYPDREFLYKGILVGIEIKTPTGTVKEHQQRKLDLYNQFGGIGVAVRSVDEVKYLVGLIEECNNSTTESERIFKEFNNKYGEN